MLASKSNFFRYLLLALMFFGSGFCGLLYQTIWLRLAFGCFGVISPVVSVIISTFMIGLAIGSFVSGKYIGAWKTKFKCSALAIYGVIELVIGLSAFAVPPLLNYSSKCLLTLGDANSFTFMLASAVGIFITILPWTIAMGMTYPVMLSFIDEVGIYDARSFGVLYTANTYGAIAGALIPVGILVEILGFTHTLLCGAAINFLIAIAALIWSFRQGASTTSKAASDTIKSDAAADTSAPIGTRFGYIVLFTTGFCCMAQEVIWVRSFSPILLQAVYSFAFLLASYLIGNGFGATLYSIQKDQRKIIPMNRLLGATAVTACFPLIASSQHAMTQLFGLTVPLITTSVAFSIGCVSAVLGYLTPNVIEQLCRNNPEKIGRAYAINIIGCTLGPLFAGYLLLPNLSARASLITMVVPLVSLLLFCAGSRIVKIVSVAACALILFVTNGYTWEDGDLSHADARNVHRDYAATTIPVSIKGRKRLLVNGNCMTTISPITRLMAHLSFSLHKTPPKEVLIICFGMGQSFQSALSWPDTHVTVVELIPGVVKSFPFFSDKAEQLIHDPRATVVIDDGRRFLNRTTQKYDVILLDPPPPPGQPGSSLLYSGKFYEAIRDHLKPDGIFQQWWGWLPDKHGVMAAMTRSVEQSFPYVRMFKAIDDPDKEMDGYHFICSTQPVDPMTPAQFLERMPASAQADLKGLSVTNDPEKEMRDRLKALLDGEHKTSEFVWPDPRLIITDDHPYNEYFLLRALGIKF